MLVILSTIIYLSIPVLAAAFTFRYFFEVKEVDQWAKCWLILIVVAGVLANIWFVYIAIILIGILAIPDDDESRVFFYLALLFALPKLAYVIPFPGIDGILKMTYPMFLGLVLLTPVYARLRERKESLSVIDKFVLAFIVLSTILDFRDHTAITQTVRLVIVNFITYWLPYRVISHTKLSLEKSLLAMGMMGVALSMESIVEWGVVWKTYASLANNIDGIHLARLQYAYYFRGLGLRVSSSWLTPITFGMYLAVACFIMLNVRKIGLKQNMMAYVLAALIFTAMLFTDSRGAQLTLMLAFLSSLYFYKSSQGWKTACKVIAVIAVIAVSLNIQAVINLDSSGSFQYRADLLTYSGDAFWRAPLLGNPNFWSNPVLVANMTQGQGIVDIVNHYLHVALRYGSVGLFIYMAIWWTAISGVSKRVSELRAINDARYMAGSVLFSVIIGLAVVIFTVSLVGYLEELIFIFFALSSAYLKNTADAKK